MFSAVKKFFQNGFDEINEVFIKPFFNLSFGRKATFLILAGLIMYVPYMNIYNASHDEQYTMLLFRYPWQEMFRLISIEDGHPPLYHIIYRLFQLGSDYHQILPLRVATLTIFLLTSLLGVFPLRRLVGDGAALMFVFCVFCLPSSFYLAVNMRMYPLALYVISGAFIYAELIFVENRKRNWLYFAAFTIAGLYTHYFCAITLFLIWSVLFVRLLIARDRSKIFTLILTGFAVSLAFLPWLVVFYQQYTNMKGTWFPKESHYMSAIYGCFFDFRSFENSILLCLTRFFGFFCWILILECLCEQVSKRKKNILWDSVIVFWGLYFVTLLISVFLRPTLYSRLMVVPMGCFYVAFSVAFVHFKKYRKIIVYMFIPLFLLYYSAYYQIANDKTVVTFKTKFEEKVEKDALVIYNDTWTHLFMMFYLPQYQAYYAPLKPYILLFQDEIVKEREIVKDLDEYSKIYYFTRSLVEDGEGKSYFYSSDDQLYLSNIYSNETVTVFEISKEEARNLIKKSENNFQRSLH